MQLTSFAVEKTGMTALALFGGPDPLVQIRADVEGVQSIVAWKVPDIVEPTDDDIAAALAAPEPPSVIPVPQIITRRQFFQQLAVQAVITEAEALAALQTGAIPAEMEPLVDGLPADQQFSAKMLIVGSGQFDRQDPLTLALGQAKGWTADQIDALWIAASAL